MWYCYSITYQRRLDVLYDPFLTLSQQLTAIYYSSMNRRIKSRLKISPDLEEIINITEPLTSSKHNYVHVSGPWTEVTYWAWLAKLPWVPYSSLKYLVPTPVPNCVSPTTSALFLFCLWYPDSLSDHYLCLQEYGLNFITGIHYRLMPVWTLAQPSAVKDAQGRHNECWMKEPWDFLSASCIWGWRESKWIYDLVSFISY